MRQAAKIKPTGDPKMTTTPTAPATINADPTTVPNRPHTATRARAAIGAMGLLTAAVVTAAVVLCGNSGSATPPATPAHVSTVPTAAHVPAAHPQPAPVPRPTPAPTPAAVPSAAIETLQRELGQLNYYEGPITGTENSETVAAITYLQRDAHLPQTGVMDAATQQALVAMLAHGNNQMGS
jgi:hypothetical protein